MKRYIITYYESNQRQATIKALDEEQALAIFDDGDGENIDSWVDDVEVDSGPTEIISVEEVTK